MYRQKCESKRYRQEENQNVIDMQDQRPASSLFRRAACQGANTCGRRRCIAVWPLTTPLGVWPDLRLVTTLHSFHPNLLDYKVVFSQEIGMEPLHLCFPRSEM